MLLANDGKASTSESQMARSNAKLLVPREIVEVGYQFGEGHLEQPFLSVEEIAMPESNGKGAEATGEKIRTKERTQNLLKTFRGL